MIVGVYSSRGFLSFTGREGHNTPDAVAAAPGFSCATNINLHCGEIHSSAGWVAPASSNIFSSNLIGTRKSFPTFTVGMSPLCAAS